MAARKIINVLFAGVLVLIFCTASSAKNKRADNLESQTISAGNGTITIYRPDKDERGTFTYKKNDGTIDRNVLEKINKIFRCRLTDEIFPIDIRLVEELDAIEDYFSASEIRLISGYRSPERNAAMHRRNRGVANNSLHMDGMAADIEVPGVPAVQLRNFAYSLQDGGVGYYGRKHFVHVDTGKIRTWGWRPAASGAKISMSRDPKNVLNK